MAKPGVRGRLSAAGPSRSAATRRALVRAAVDVLKSDGFGGASARAIAERAGCNQALVFYHFGTVVDLLLAALDEVSSLRSLQYREAVAQVRSPAELVDAAAGIFREDLDAGHIAVLAELIAGASSTPGLGAQVAERIEPWEQFAARIVGDVFGGGALASAIPAAEAAHAIVAMYLGLEMLARLDGNRAPAVALFERAKSIAGLLSSLGASTTTEPPEEDP